MKTASMRLDEALKSQGLVTSREKAKALILEGSVTVDGEVIVKPSYLINDQTLNLLKQPYVSRSAIKLLQALTAWDLDFQGLNVLDIGASTGGFTQVALEKGAAKVCALDVGTGQLAAALSSDPRVINLENIHFLKTRKEDFAAFDVTLIDVSFISSLKILNHALKVLQCDQYMVLFKPQFEMNKPMKNPIIKERERLSVKKAWTNAVEALGFGVMASLDVSPGKKGNQESIFYLKVKSC